MGQENLIETRDTLIIQGIVNQRYRISYVEDIPVLRTIDRFINPSYDYNWCFAELEEPFYASIFEEIALTQNVNSMHMPTFYFERLSFYKGAGEGSKITWSDHLLQSKEDRFVCLAFKVMDRSYR